MVKPTILIKSKNFLKRELVLAITILVVAFSFLSNFASAAEMKISDEEVERVKKALNIINTASNFGSILIDGGNLMTVLKTAVKGGGAAADVTYGLLVLSAINEIEFMDLVLSQDYKDIAKAYFSNILEERTSLRSYWKGVGFDLPRVLSGKITGPMGALTLNTFEMTDKVISILTAFKNLETVKRYDGLWYYFDFRRGGDSHEEAWNFAKWQMQWVGSPELEQQFASLWEKWGPYATPDGISKQYKEQVKSDLRNTLALAIEEHTETGSLYVKEPSLWEKFSAQLAKIKNVIANIASQVKNPFSAGPIVELPAETPAEVPTETRSLQTEEWSDVGSPTISESQENLDDLLEQADLVTEVSADNGSPQAEEPVLLPKVEELDLIETVEATTTELASEPELVSREDSPLQAEEVAEDGPPPVSAELCQRENGGAARQYRVLIDKVAWMGDKESTSHEWIELKNIWGMPINLAGWQLQDKDRQIKIIFGQEDIISEQGFYFLERSKDYTGALNNSNEALYLFDNQCNVEDEVLANPKWPAGDNSTKEPMKRFDVNYWYSGNAPSAEIFYGSPALAPEPTQEIISNNSNAAASSLAVVFNEIAWAGTKANSADEWIELYNNTASTVDLTGWKIKKDNEDWIIFTTSTIPAAGYYLLERTDDSAVNSTSADQIFTGAMNNSGEKLELYNNSGILIDSIDASSGWPAGQASPNYISMERINSASTTISTNWASNNRIARNGFDADNNAINGTPKAENSVSKQSTNIPSNFAITEDLILTYLGNPYLVEGLMLVSGAKLTIESGVTVKFRHIGAANQNAFLKVENGALEAVGTAAQKITLTSSNAQPQAGDWDGIYLQNSTSTLENIIVRYGGKWHQPSSYEWPAYTYGALYIDGGSAQISNSLIEKSQTFGLWLKNSTTSQIISAEFKENPGTGDRPAAVYIENSSPTIKNSIFQNNEIGILTGNFSAPTIKDNQFIQNTAPIQIASLLGSISGNTFQNNDTDGVLVSSFGFSSQYGEINWEKIAVPYFIGAALSVPSGYTLTIEPGVEIRLKGSGQINVDGNLKAIGTSQNKIIFTGANEVPGAWKYIKFSASSTESILENTVVSYGGAWDNWGGPKYGAVKIEGLNFVIKDSLFENNRTAIELINADFASQSNNISIQNNEVGIYVSAGASPGLSDVAFGTGEDANHYNTPP